MIRGQLLILAAALLLTACAQETTRIDREWGEAQRVSWQKMLVNPEGAGGAAPPTGLEGIHAEGVMDAYNRSFARETEPLPVFELGVTGSNGN